MRDLARYDVIHTTDGYFAYARTAELACRLWGKPLVSSIHTDTPTYTRVDAERILRRIVANRWAADWLIHARRMPDRLADGMTRKLHRHLRLADWTFVGAAAATGAASPRSSILRRGADIAHFNPARRCRSWLESAQGIGPKTKLVLFVGRLDEGKGIRLLARALKHLIDTGEDVVGVFAGLGKERDFISSQLGNRAILLGQLDRQHLADIYANADLFAFPSEIEISPNVVLEAQASGSACLVAPNGGGRFVARDGADGIVIASRAPEDWAVTMSALLADDARRKGIGSCAREDVGRWHPSWEQIVLEDLFPVWLRSVALRKGHADGYVPAAPAYSHSAS